MEKTEDFFDEEFKKREVIERIIKKAIDKVKDVFKNIKIEYKFKHPNVELKIKSFIDFSTGICFYNLYHSETSKTLKEKENDFIEMYYQLLRFAILKEWDSFILK